jgi:hypothetical protein
MAAHDPDMAQRLHQLRNGRTLINVLPRAEAPADLLEQVKLSLERRSLLEERSILTSTRAGVRHLRMRRFLAAAAMIALVGVLAFVVFQIVEPAPPGRSTNWTAAPTSETPSPAPVLRVAANLPFSGRLELSTPFLNQAASSISTSAENNGLSYFSQSNSSGTRVVCRIVGSRERLDGLLADLNAMGPNFKAARLLVETDRFANPIAVDAATFPQVADILNQNTLQTRMQAAKDIAILNRFARQMPGREIQAATSQKLDGAISELSSIPWPKLASQDRKYPTMVTPLEGETQVKASLTIVLLSAQ